MTFDGISHPQGKLVSESQVTMARQMMPNDANPWGYVHGGVVMKMVDVNAPVRRRRDTRAAGWQRSPSTTCRSSIPSTSAICSP